MCACVCVIFLIHSVFYIALGLPEIIEYESPWSLHVVCSTFFLFSLNLVRNVLNLLAPIYAVIHSLSFDWLYCSEN